jgi:hypothetical protein
MAQIPILILAAAATACIIASTPFTAGGADSEGSPIFGVKIPPGYRDWRLISVAHEEGNLNDLRAILGNDVAIEASREGRLPYPDGTIIARLAWSYDPLEESSKAFGRLQSFVAGPPKNGVQFMVKDSGKIRLDRRLGVRSIQRPQTRRRGGAQHLPSLPRDRQSSRLCLQPLCTLKAEGGERACASANRAPHRSDTGNVMTPGERTGE